MDNFREDMRQGMIQFRLTRAALAISVLLAVTLQLAYPEHFGHLGITMSKMSLWLFMGAGFFMLLAMVHIIRKASDETTILKLELTALGLIGLAIIGELLW